VPVGEAGRIRCANKQRFADIFYSSRFAFKRNKKSQCQYYWRIVKDKEEQAKCGNNFAALGLLVEKSPFYFALLTRRKYVPYKV
jgi:hypothetical protein